MSTTNPYRFGSEVVRACAGDGKTTRLSKRIIKLLVNDVPPEQIIALIVRAVRMLDFLGPGQCPSKSHLIVIKPHIDTFPDM